MERKKASKTKAEVAPKRVKARDQKSTKPLWRKTTTGTLYPFPNKRNQRVRHKEEIRATREELGKYVDQFDLIEGDAELHKQVAENKAPKAVAEKAALETYEAIHTGGGWHNVVQASTGKIMNTKKLKADDAQALIESFESENAVQKYADE